MITPRPTSLRLAPCALRLAPCALEPAHRLSALHPRTEKNHRHNFGWNVVRSAFLGLGLLASLAIAQDATSPLNLGKHGADEISPQPAQLQEHPTMGILEAKLVGAEVDTTVRPLFTAAVRSTAIRLVKDSVDVIEGSKLERLIQVNAASCSNASCLAKFARSAGVDYLLETRMILRKGTWTAMLKLASAKSENLLDEETADYETEQAAKVGLVELATKALQSFSKSNPNVVPQEVMAPTGAKRAVVLFVSNPPGAAVTVDGKFFCQTNSGKALVEGKHWIEMGKDGYRSRLERVEVSGNGQELSWDLVPIKTRLTLDAVDAKTGEDLIADVYLGGKLVGRTPFDDLVPVASGAVAVQANGTERTLVDVTLAEGKICAAKVQLHRNTLESSPCNQGQVSEVKQKVKKGAKKAKKVANSSNDPCSDSPEEKSLWKSEYFWTGSVLLLAIGAGIVGTIVDKINRDDPPATTAGWTAKVVW